MGNSGSSQAPVWVAPTSITASSSPLGVLRRLTTTSAVNCIGRYRSQSQTLHIFDSGSLEDLCDDLASECKQFADPVFRRQLIALFTGKKSRNSYAHDSSTVSRGSTVSPAAGPAVSVSSQSAKDASLPGDEADYTPPVQVDSLAVISSLLFLSDGTLAEKVEHCGRLLCWTQELEVEPAAVFLLLAAVVRGVALLIEEPPPSVLLLGEVLTRLGRKAIVITTSAKFRIEANGQEQPSTDTQPANQLLLRQLGGVSAAGPHSSFFSGLPSCVSDTLHKFDGQVWTSESVWEALAEDAAVQAYHDRVTQVFFLEQIEERLATLSSNFKRVLQRVCNPEAYRAEQRANAAASQQQRGSRASRLSKLSAGSGGGSLHDLTPLSWRQVQLLLRCCDAKAVSALLLDEMQFEATVACQEVGIRWKKWVDEPLRESLDDEELSVEILGTTEASAPTHKQTNADKNLTSTGQTGNSTTTANVGKPASALSAGEAETGLPVNAAASASGRDGLADTPGGRETAGSSSSSASRQSDGGDTNEGAGGESATFAKPTWKFVPSSGPCVWSDDLQMFVTPLLAFSAIDCHGEGVISSRNLDLLFNFLKQLDPVHGGFYSRLEKVLAADTRALFSIPSDVPDPFAQLRAELSPEKQQIRLLRFGVIIAVCAAVQDRRQHETSLNNRFRRFDVDKSGFILTTDMQLLLTEMIRRATEIDDASTAVEQALQNVVDKYMNLFIGPTVERVEYATFLSAYDRVRKTSSKLRADIMELAAMFAPEPTRRQSRARSELKIRQSSSSTRIRASLLRKNSRANKGSSRSIVGDEGIKNLFSKK
ncbi:hypothetical protein TGME49_248590 [Toxoplasma gondii ME49]|uniref:EF hand protein n=2 Tax=Toxoplasma gondii TaxID=5811 RepID=B6KH82_TOXGV|nr:hypothetical protein TGME49_248590 [Toxoplasma gondii ME49]EPT25024.1 hypothetical protein TGME49_248590 [Toxoplasma gondii ME49]ESS34269.1 putative EF hand protein [Toxoplasma gondii VEG]|eukprot:XP_002367205.1 hypothetical protein TGME49_248590 [Toxoplasma gondii ME49]